MQEQRVESCSMLWGVRAETFAGFLGPFHARNLDFKLHLCFAEDALHLRRQIRTAAEGGQNLAWFRDGQAEHCFYLEWTSAVHHRLS